ncbi:unnamed protein product, partial [Chrysoparadoxa australica]
MACLCCRNDLRERARAMFIHAYDSYMSHALPYGELKPLSCKGGEFHLVKIPLVTLIDTLDTLVVLGNYTEFRHAVDIVTTQASFSLDRNVSVFETNIRCLGGLLSAHMMAVDPDLGIYPEGGYDGGLLTLAEDLGKRLLPAFQTRTGVPYGTVNLLTGVPPKETEEASLAQAGSLTIEFSVLSALTKDGSYAQAAEKAVRALFLRRCSQGLLGKHINITTGQWTQALAGIGSNADSFYEYLLKMYILWGEVGYWDMFMECYIIVQVYLRLGDWYADVELQTAKVRRQVFESLTAFWPGMQTLIGDLQLSSRTLNAFFLVWREYGFIPEEYDYVSWQLGSSGGSLLYPLRPELIESALFQYQATKDPSWLWAGSDFLVALESHCRVDCGYASINDIARLQLDDDMPSYFLSETIKYLFLLFDEDNFLHGEEYIFSTEAHPFKIKAVRNGGFGDSA